MSDYESMGPVSARPQLIMSTQPHAFLPAFTSHADESATTVGVRIVAFGGELQAVGSAKKHPDDPSEPEIGLALATARAMRAAADELEGAANMLVEKRSAERRHRLTLVGLEQALKEASERIQAVTDATYPTEPDDSWLDEPFTDAIAEVQFGRAKGAVERELSHFSIREIVAVEDEDLLELPGIGQGTVDKIREALKNYQPA